MPFLFEVSVTLGDLIIRIVVQGDKAIAEIVGFKEAVKKQSQETQEHNKKAALSFRQIGDAAQKAWFTISTAKMLLAPLGEMIAASNTLEASERKLEATSKLTGQSISFLSTTSSQAKTDLGLSTVQANELTISLAKLGQKAGDVSNTGEAIKRLLDVASAQGLNAEQALMAINQAILGIDEGTDKLFQKNPSVIYEEFARSIGTTAGRLTDQQKAQAMLNEVMTSGNKVQGEYSRFLESNAGKSAQMKQRADEARAAIGGMIAQFQIIIFNVAGPILDFFNKMDSGGQKTTVMMIGLTALLVKLPAIVNSVTASVKLFDTAAKTALGPIGLLITALTALKLAADAFQNRKIEKIKLIDDLDELKTKLAELEKQYATATDKTISAARASVGFGGALIGTSTDAKNLAEQIKATKDRITELEAAAISASSAGSVNIDTSYSGGSVLLPIGENEEEKEKRINLETEKRVENRKKLREETEFYLNGLNGIFGSEQQIQRQQQKHNDVLFAQAQQNAAAVGKWSSAQQSVKNYATQTIDPISKILLNMQRTADSAGRLGNIISTTIGGALADAITKANSLKDALRNAGKTILNTVLGNVFSGIGNILTGGLFGLANNVTGGALTKFSKFFGFASGGEVLNPTLAMVGETQPEIIAPKQDFITVVKSLQIQGAFAMAQPQLIGGGNSALLERLDKLESAISKMQFTFSVDGRELAAAVDKGQEFRSRNFI